MSKMLTYPLATAAVLLLLAGESSAKKTAAKPAAAAKKHPRAIRNDFLKAMGGHQNTKKRRQRKLNLKDFQDELKKDNDSARALRKKVFKKATFRTPAQRRLDEANDDAAGNDDAAEANDDANNNNNAQNNYNRYQYNNGNNGYNYNGNYNNQYQNGGQYYWEEDAQQYYQNYKQYNQQNNQGNYKYNQNKDGTDDGFAVFGDWENGFDFDPTQYSVSYYGCAEVKQYEDWVAADEDVDGVFATKHFAVFRFCPERTCMGWQEEDEEIECDEDYYGEDYCDYVAEYAQYYKQVEEYEKKWQQQYGNQVDENGDPVEYDEEAAKQYYYDAAMYDEEDINQYGARGEGCEANYGEYMILMQDYLEIMLEWQEERYNTYLNYCEDCMYKVYQQWLKNGGNRDRKLMTYDDFKASDEHRQLRKLSEDHRELGGYYGACPEYDTCSEYQKMGGMDDDYSDYFECTEVQRNNGQVAYIGPHCAEDKYTITLGLYGDQYCNEYIGNGVDISSFLQEEWDVEEDMLKKYYNSAYGSLEELKMINEENVCIPCNKEDLMWEVKGNTDDQNMEYDDGEINELCEAVYEVSARCDKHYRSYTSKSKLAKYSEAVAQEDLACDFIESVVEGNFNENGEVDVGNNYYKQGNPTWWGNNMYTQEYGHYASEVTGLQIALLVMSIAAVCLLTAWSLALHKSASKSAPWRPRRGFRSSSAANAPAANPDLSRQNSGIVMGRSASNTSYYMS